MASYASVCQVVEELLPLWRQGHVLPDTALFVEDHLAHCEACQTLERQSREEESRAAASVSHAAPMEVARDDHLRRLLRRHARTLVTLLAGLSIVLMSGGVASAWSRQAETEARYQRFLKSVPGYETATEYGAVAPLDKEIRMGDETVTLRALYATYLGTYFVFTLRAKRGKAPAVPSLAWTLPAPSSPASSGAGSGSITAVTVVDMSKPRATAQITQGEIAGYWEIPSLRVSSPLVIGPPAPSRALRFTLSLPAPGLNSVPVRLALPKGAFRPKGEVTLRRPLALRGDGATLRLESLMVSSAGAIVRGTVQGGGQHFSLVAPCPPFLGKGACRAQGDWQVVGQDAGGVHAFAWILPAPPASTRSLPGAAIPLTGMRPAVTRRVTASVGWPIATLPEAVATVPLGKVSGCIVEMTPPDERGFTVVLVAPSTMIGAFSGASTRVLGVQVRLPDGRVLSATDDPEGVYGEPVGQFAFGMRWGTPPTPAELAEVGTARITVTLVTHPISRFAKGTVWRP